MQADAATREEVLMTLGEFRTAVSQKRIEGVLALFTPDADTTLIGSSAGELARGPMEMRPFLEDVFDSPQTLSWGSDRAYRISGVLERRSGRWLWSLFHGSEPS
ncbi:MAG: hypothetical protein QOJ29_1388 [Thermoleophilaceae bacterium]|jgi:hypothetical protein|nr:hypothetical protein [Thermoleophilaceae bacterium]